jgi:hypothetical protein
LESPKPSNEFKLSLTNTNKSKYYVRNLITFAFAYNAS